MKKILSLLIGATVAVIVVAAVLVPIIDDAEFETKSVGQNVNARYRANIGTELAGDLEYTYVDNTPALNGDVLNFNMYNVRNIICVSDAFMLKQNSSLTAYTLRNDEGVVDVTRLRINSDMTYEYTTTVDTTVTVDSAIEYLFYADDVGTLGAFWEGSGSYDDFWLDHNEAAYVSSLSTLNAEGQPSITFRGLWSADSTTIGESWTPIYTQIISGGASIDHPIDFKVGGLNIHEGDLANRYSFNGYHVSATINDIEYSQSRWDPIVFAPLEYHYHTASDYSILGLLGAIPVLVIAGIIVYVARTVVMGRGE